MSYEKGRCHNCGKIDDRIKAGRFYCAKCAAKDKERATRRQEKLKSERRCMTCGAQDERTLSGRCQCALCAKFRAAKERLRNQVKKEKAAGNCDPQAAKNELSTKL